jgi:hypothetical protein
MESMPIQQETRRQLQNIRQRIAETALARERLDEQIETLQRNQGELAQRTATLKREEGRLTIIDTIVAIRHEYERCVPPIDPQSWAEVQTCAQGLDGSWHAALQLAALCIAWVEHLDVQAVATDKQEQAEPAGEDEEAGDDEDETAPLPPAVATLPLSFLGLPTRFTMALRRAGLKTIGDYAVLSYRKRLSIRNFGIKSLEMAQDSIAQLVDGVVAREREESASKEEGNA